jgi:type II secretory pathway pseudopilin PulG
MAERIWMLISIQANCSTHSKLKTHNSVSGFTFLEILVVITLVVLLIGMAVPQFFAIFSKAHEVEYKHLKIVLKMLRNDAVLKSTSYCLLFDLKNQQMMVSAEDPTGKCSEDFLQEPKLLKTHIFPEEFRLLEAKPAESNYLSSGGAADLLVVHINSSGFVTPFFLHFSEPDSSISGTLHFRR